MKKKNENKGFTLVELIVVLVILAILAAILVPALLGYIDRARNQQIVLNAKSAMTATQAELSSMYGGSKTLIASGNTMTNAEFTSHTNSVIKTAEIPTGATASFSTGQNTDTDKHPAYTVKKFMYSENGVTLYFDVDNNTSWESTAPTGWTAPTVTIQ